MSAIRKILISEVEDSIRRQEGSSSLGEEPKWKDARQAYLDLAAYLIIFVETGDQYAAEAEAQDEGGDSQG